MYHQQIVLPVKNIIKTMVREDVKEIEMYENNRMAEEVDRGRRMSAPGRKRVARLVIDLLYKF